MDCFAIARPLCSSLSGASLLHRRPLYATPAPAAAPISIFGRPLYPFRCPLLRPLPRLHRLKPSLSPVRAASSPEKNPNPTSPQPPSLPQGAKPVPVAISLAIGLAVCFLVPRPVEVTPQAWQLLAIFLSTIAGLVLSPLPVGAWAFLGLTASIFTQNVKLLGGIRGLHE